MPPTSHIRASSYGPTSILEASFAGGIRVEMDEKVKISFEVVLHAGSSINIHYIVEFPDTGV